MTSPLADVPDWTDDDTARLKAAYASVRDELLSHCVEKNGQPAHWYGELSSSPLSTATAVMAIVVVRRSGRSASDYGLAADFDLLIQRGLDWLAGHQNEDGGWGDTVKSLSNISTTMLAHAVFHAAERTGKFSSVVEKAKACIDEAGGVPAVVARYGKDKTFSVPILTHCALAGLVDWGQITALPFELSCLPAKFYKTVRLPVVSYALPALIAIGQVRHHHKPTWNPITRVLRNLAVEPSLRVLERIQPPNGGFLEAAPLTSFVTMSLAGKGLADHPVVKRGLSFLCESVREDGSWPIDTNLATWVTTLSINALKENVPEPLRAGLSDWLIEQQYKEVHPFTNADPGGWAWTDLPGGVPDGDDTPGAILSLLELHGETPQPIAEPTTNAVKWLLDLQNRDGGFPTFCRGWGTLPFDRSSADITAHCLRALLLWQARGFQTLPMIEKLLSDGELSTDPDDPEMAARMDELIQTAVDDPLTNRLHNAMTRGLVFLEKAQRKNGSWVPLWFGNQFGRDDENPVYGTARVLMFYREMPDEDSELNTPEAFRAAEWLASVQHPTAQREGEAPAEPQAQPGQAGWLGSNGVSPRQADTGGSLPLDPSHPESCAETGGQDGGSAGASPSPDSPLAPHPSPLAHAGGWGGDAGLPPTVEETALAAEALLSFKMHRKNAFDGIRWLISRVEDGSVSEPSPIGFYFARLWYFEKLYPLIFAASALRRAVEFVESKSGS
ncbi:MAG: squalene--hopene cyclase [Planctomycetota bacterium]|nr:squalene--hopene cyclase [Planctomycetota bacterium]